MKNNNTAVAVVAAVLLAASFLFDGAAVKFVGSIQTQPITAAVAFFNRYFIWIYGALLAATTAAILKAAAKKDKGKKIFAMATSIATAMAVTQLLKPIIHRLRPDGLLFINPLFGSVEYSFPSGHTTAAAAAAFSAPPALRAVWLAFTAATLVSRVYSNVHFLSDTVGGLIVAFAVTAFVKSRLKENITAKDNLEIRRQLVHLLIGLAIAAFVWKYPQLWYVIPVIAAAGIALSHVVKSVTAVKNGTIKKLRKSAVAVLELVERKKELRDFPGKGAVMLFLGAGITAAIFRKEAVAAIAILAVGDSISPLAGKFFGRTKHKGVFASKKTVEGSIAGFVFAAAAAAFLVPVWTAIIAAAAGMVIEAIHLRIGKIKIDDNLTVPIAAAAVMWALRLV